MPSYFNAKRYSLLPILCLPLTIAIIIQTSCRKLVAIGSPETQINNSEVFTSDASAIAAATGIYIDFSARETGIVSGGLSLFGGLAADELKNHTQTPNYQEFNNNNLTASNNVLLQWWTEIYKNIYTANLILEELPGSGSVSASAKKQLEGEARFIRAFLHFYAVNLFGPVPYITATEYHENAMSERVSVDSVYDWIIKDLLVAESLLPGVATEGRRLRPNRAAATSLLSRVFLYSENWEDAEKKASEVIDLPTGLKIETDLNKVFLAGSPEAIWQLQPVRPMRNTNEGFYFTVQDALRIASLSDEFYQSAFEAGDKRKEYWVAAVTAGGDNYYSPYKYKVGQSSELSEYQMVFRLGEIFLIRAEARARLNKLALAENDLNVIRNRAGLSDFMADSQDHLLAAIAQERKVELFVESGHRWLDLKRRHEADNLLSVIKSSWETTDILFPIPQKQLENNPGFLQNTGY